MYFKKEKSYFIIDSFSNLIAINDFIETVKVVIGNTHNIV